jgi:hypothetical protein
MALSGIRLCGWSYRRDRGLGRNVTGPLRVFR